MNEKNIFEDPAQDDVVEDAPESTPDLVQGMAAESSPVTKMPDPFEGQRGPAQDPIAESLERQITQLGRNTAKKLKECPQDEILIPIKELNPHDLEVTCAINGWRFQMQRGVKLTLPRPVVSLLVAAGYQPTLVR